MECLLDRKKPEVLKFSYKKHLPCLSALLLGWDHAIDGFSLLKLLLHFNHQLDTINHQLDLLNLGGAETVGVGDVKHTTDRGCVHATWVQKHTQSTIETDCLGIADDYRMNRWSIPL